VDEAGEHLLAGAGLAGQEDREGTVGEPAGESNELDRLLGNPEAFGVGVEGFGGPEGGALLFVATVLVEGEGGAYELSNVCDCAFISKFLSRPGKDFPRLVSIPPQSYRFVDSSGSYGGMSLG
jgi:hypothetical protein